MDMAEITENYTKQVWIYHYNIWVSPSVQNDQNQNIYTME